jgi:hypothetical protein
MFIAQLAIISVFLTDFPTSAEHVAIFMVPVSM